MSDPKVVPLARPEPPEVAAARNQVGAIVEQAKAHRITDDVTRGAAADLRAALKKADKVLEEARTALVGPLNDHVRFINAKFKPLADQVAQAVLAIDKEIVRDRQAREAAALAERRRLEAEAEAKRRAAEEEQQRHAREVEERTQKAAAEAGLSAEDGRQLGTLFAQDVLAQLPAPVIQVAPPPPPPKTIVSAIGSQAQVRKLWDFDLLDVGKLATAYPKTVEVRRGDVLALIRALEADGASEAALEHAVPGIRAFKRDSVSG
jgi:hypothetical protein